MSVLGWRLLFEPSFGAFNWLLEHLGVDRIWLGETGWARFSVILVTVWFGAPFFMVMYLASLKSVPEELYEAASIDGATWWQRIRYVTFPMMRNIVALTMIFSLIGSFAGFTIVSVLTNGGPLGRPGCWPRQRFSSASWAATSRWVPACRCSWCRSWPRPRSISCAASPNGGVTRSCSSGRGLSCALLSRALLAALAQDRQDLGGGGQDVGAQAVDGSDARLLEEVVVLGEDDAARPALPSRPAWRAPR